MFGGYELNIKFVLTKYILMPKPLPTSKDLTSHQEPSGTCRVNKKYSSCCLNTTDFSIRVQYYSGKRN